MFPDKVITWPDMNAGGLTAAPVAPQMFGNAGLEHMEKYGESSLCEDGQLPG